MGKSVGPYLKPFVFTAISSGLVIFLLASWKGCGKLEHWTLDRRVQWRVGSTPTPEMTIFLIQDEDLGKIRARYALKELIGHYSQPIGIDIVLDDSNSKSEKIDKRIRNNAIHKDVYYAFGKLSSNRTDEDNKELKHKRREALKLFNWDKIRLTGKNKEKPEILKQKLDRLEEDRLWAPYPDFVANLSQLKRRQPAQGVGHTYRGREQQKVARKVPLLIIYEDSVYPFFSLRIACALEDVKTEEIEVSLGKSIRLTDYINIPIKPGYIKLNNDIKIPIDERGYMYVNYVAPLDKIEHHTLKVMEVNGEYRLGIKGETANGLGELPSANSVILVGAKGGSGKDFWRTPLGMYPGVVIHANIIENIRTKDFLTPPNISLRIPVAVILGVFIGLIFTVSRGPRQPEEHWLKCIYSGRGLLFTISLLFLYLSAVLWLFNKFRIWLDVVSPLVVLMLMMGVYLVIGCLRLVEVAQTVKALPLKWVMGGIVITTLIIVAFAVIMARIVELALAIALTGTIVPTAASMVKAYISSRLNLSYSLTVESQPVGVNVQVSPADARGREGGTTPLVFEYKSGDNLTLKAPESWQSQEFHHWEVNGEDRGENATIVISMNAACTAVAHYGPSIIIPGGRT